MSEFTGIICTGQEGLRRLNARSFICDILFPGDDRDRSDGRLYVPGAVVPDLNTTRPFPGKALYPFLATAKTPDQGRIEIISGRSNEMLAEIEDQRSKTRRAAYCPAGQVTTTINHRAPGKPFEGLHFDNFENRLVNPPLEASDRLLQSQRRIGLNFGDGNRVLWLTSVDVFDIARDRYTRDKQQGNRAESFVPVADHLREYARNVQGTEKAVKCLGVILGDGEGYVVNTENAGHDGGTPNLLDIFSNSSEYSPEQAFALVEKIGGVALQEPARDSLVCFYLGDWKPGTFGSLI